MSNTSKKGNGSLPHHDTHEDEEGSPAKTIGHRGNRRMLSILADYLTEAKVHTSRLEALYIALKEMTVEPSPIWSGTLLTEFERHYEADKKNLDSMRSHITGKQSAPAEAEDDED